MSASNSNPLLEKNVFGSMIKLGVFMQSDDPGLSKCILHTNTNKIFLINKWIGKKNSFQKMKHK